MTRNRLSYWLCLVVALFFARPVYAYSVWKPGHAWSGSAIHYSINLDSFAALTLDAAMTANQWVWWINYSASNWRDRTGTTLSFAYDGGTGAGWLDDGISTVMATSGCSPSAGGCTILAETDDVIPWYTSDIVEFDVRFYQPPGVIWSVQGAGGNAQTDFPAAAVHEFGHVLNLAHSAGAAVMNQSQNATIARFPLDDDYNGALALYPTASQPTLYWRKLGSSGWGAETTSSGAGWTRMNPTAAIGAGAAGASWVVTGNWGANKQVYFNRATLPLSSSSTWTTRTAGSTRLSLRPPAIAARKTGSPYWVAAWPVKWNLGTDPCPGASLLVSTDGFLTGTMVDNPSVCTVHEIGLTFDAASGRFVMLWVARDAGNPAANNDVVMASSSVDGFVWTPPASLGFRAFDTASIACGALGTCMVAYPKWDQNDAIIVTQGAVVGTTGTVTLQGSTTYPDRVQRLVTVGASSLAGLSKFIFAEHWSTAQNDWSAGVGHLWTSESSNVPYSSYTWRDVGVSSPHASALATGTSFYDDTYIFYVK